MRRKSLFFILILFITVLAACNNDADETKDEEELAMLEVAFDVPETAEVGDTLTLEAVVTYGDEDVTDADEVNFEYWENNNKDDSITIDSKNNNDGTYTAEVILENESVYTIYAHTTARELHTMPKRTVIVGDAEPLHEDTDADHESVDGFSMHFMNPEEAKATEETELMVHLEMDEQPFENGEVRYEIWNDDISENHEWLDVEESVPGEYIASHIFEEAGTYKIQVHVEDDDDLHEHEEYDIEVTE